MQQLASETVEAMVVRYQVPGSAADARDTISAAMPAPLGIERRLVRRAEHCWAALRTGAALPPADAAAALLGPPFATQALLVRRPAADSPCTGRLLYAGDELLRLGIVVEHHGGDHVGGDTDGGLRPATRLGDRLLALGLEAISSAAPVSFDSERDDGADSTEAQQLLTRAVALPFAPSGGSMTAVVILSWRRLLSREETAALHRELAAAIDWMQQHRPSPA